jgi:hypothetical protein
MILKQGPFPLVAGILALCLSGCGASITGKLEQGGAGDFNVSAVLEPGITATLRSFLAFSQGPVSGPGPASGDLLIDAPAIALSMSRAPGVASASFRNTGPAALEGPLKIANIGEFLAPSAGSLAGGRGFITFTENPGGGGGAFITLSREAGPGMLSLISTEVADYLSALLAPIATGEVLTKAEYLALVASIYGSGVSGEISRASIRAVVEFPGALLSVKGGVFSGNKAEFTIPLVDLLVLEQPLSYEVVWR